MCARKRASKDLCPLASQTSWLKQRRKDIKFSAGRAPGIIECAALGTEVPLCVDDVSVLELIGHCLAGIAFEFGIEREHCRIAANNANAAHVRSEEHTSELQSRFG